MSEVMVTSTLHAAAETFANVLTSEPRWVAWQEAQAAVEQDKHLVNLFNRYNTLTEPWRTGQQLGEETVTELNALEAEIRSNSVYVTRERAASGMMQLLQDANDAIGEVLHIDFAATVSPKSCNGSCG